MCMNAVSQIIRATRVNMGFTQASLAHLSSVGLATIQNIEAGITNPTIDILNKIFAVLGLTFEVQPIMPSIDDGIKLGLPLSTTRGVLNYKNQSEKDLVLYLKKMGPHILNLKDERIKDALFSLMLAIHNHYPKIFRKINYPKAIISELISMSEKGHVVKLSRIALANVSQYL